MVDAGHGGRHDEVVLAATTQEVFMGPRLLKEIDRLKRRLLTLSGHVEKNVRLAVKAVSAVDRGIAEQVFVADPRVDEMEVDVEEECLKVLALHQPVARDLRYIIAILKINNDLERIGDLAVNIARCVRYLPPHSRVPKSFELETMATTTRKMLSKSLDALVNVDHSLAQEVLEDDDVVDRINSEVYGAFTHEACKAPDKMEALLQYLIVSRSLERIADLATNISEDVIYLMEGAIIRHGDGRGSA